MPLNNSDSRAASAKAATAHRSLEPSVISSPSPWEIFWCGGTYMRRGALSTATITQVTTRREFMARAGAAGLGVTLGAGTGASGEAEAAAGHPAAVSFFGTNQAGIATPTQEHVHFLAL